MTDTIERPAAASEGVPDRPPQAGRPSLAWFAGARRDVLASCPSETRFYNALGLAVLLTGCLSGVTMAVALGYVLRRPPVHLWPVSVAWSAFIINLDRLLVMMPVTRKFAVAAAGRLLISLFIGIQIAEPLVLTIFQPEIRAQLQSDTQNALQRAEAGVARYYQPMITRAQEQIGQLRAQEQNLVADVDHDKFISACEAAEQSCSITHELGCGPVCQHYAQLAASAQADLESIKPADDAQISADEGEIRTLTSDEQRQQGQAATAATGDTGLIAREDALSEIERAHPGTAYEVWFIRISLILLDLMPLILKIVHVLDGSSYEHVAAAWKRRDMLTEDELDLGTGVAKERLEQQARADRDVNRIVIRFDRDRRIAEAQAAWTNARGGPYPGADPGSAYPGADPGSTYPGTYPAPEAVRALSLHEYVSSMRGQGDQESMAVAMPRMLAIAGWAGTGLIVALAVSLGAVALVSGQILNIAWLVWLLAFGGISLTVFTRGYRRAPGWALRATLATLFVGLALPLLVAVLNL